MEIGILMRADRDLGATVARYVRCMEELSPEYFWLPDRLLANDYSALKKFGQVYSQAPFEFLDPFVTIAALARATDKVPNFGIAVTDLIRRGVPDLVRLSDTMTQLLGKPFNMGVGAGEAINLTPLGYAHGSKPIGHLEEQLRKYCRVMEQGIFDGPDGCAIHYGYNRNPSKVWVGGQRDRMLRITAQYADGWLPAWKMSANEYGEKALSLREQAAVLGRSCPKLGMFAPLLLGESKQALLRHFKAHPLTKTPALNASADIWRKWGVGHPAGDSAKGLFDVVSMKLGADDLYQSLVDVPEEIMDEVMFLGNVDEVLDEFAAYRELGLEHIALLLPPSDGGIKKGMQPGDCYGDFKKLCDILRQW